MAEPGYSPLESGISGIPGIGDLGNHWKLEYTFGQVYLADHGASEKPSVVLAA
jgi:hypothetical protein